MPNDAYEAAADAWPRVGEAVKARRRELGLKITQAVASQPGVGTTVWSNLENGHPVNNRISYEAMGAICRALGWSSDSIQRLASGQAAVELNSLGQEQEVMARLWRVEETVRELLVRFQRLEELRQRSESEAQADQASD